MSNNDNIGAGGMLVAFIAGAVTGAAVALLFAPATGDETREYLSERAREGRARAEAAARDAARQGREAMARGREQINNAIDRGREAYQSARETEQDA